MLTSRFPRYQRKMTMVDAVTSSITDPYGTMEHLLKERESPPFIVSSFIAMLVVLVLPSIVYQYWFDIQPAMIETTYAVCIALSITFVFFVMFMAVFLRLIGISAPMIKIFAASVYALTPTVPLMIGYYVGNYVTIGRITVLTFFVTGRRASGDWFLTFLPYFMDMAFFFAFFVFSQGIRVIGKMGFPTSVMVGMVAAPILLGAYLIGLMCAESLINDSAVLVTKFLRSIVTIPTT